MAKNILVLYLLAHCFTAFSQKNGIQIKMVDQQNKAVIGATISLQNTNDTTKRFFQITDTLGVAKFDLENGKKYKLKTSSVGYKPLLQEIEISQKIKQFVFVMEDDNTLLGGVSVIAKKPLMRQEEDKTIVDPETLAESSTNAYEIMEKIPGIFVDNDGNIYLNGSSPSSIYINSREQKMSAADVATILKSLPPNSIEKIELMRTSSAKYDASGGGGVINIVLKKGVKIGRTGSITAGANQGKFGAQFMGVNLMNNDGDKSSYLNFNLNNRNYFERLETNRILSTGNTLSQKSYNKMPSQGVFLGYGKGRIFNKNYELNTDGRLSINANNSYNENNNNLLDNSGLFAINSSSNFVKNTSPGLNFNQGITGKKNLDTLGSSLIVDLSYNFLSKKTNQDFLTKYILPQKTDLLGIGDFTNQRNSFEAKIDFIKKLPKKFAIEAGYKSAFQWFGSHTNFLDIQNNIRVQNIPRSNKYSYQDGIHAVYFQGSKTVNDYIFKAGIRGENTNMYGRQLMGKDTSFTVKRTDFFPYLYLSKKLMKIAGYEIRAFLIAKRSITRPTYDYLNPSVKYLDQFLYEAGNPGLKPQFTETYEANISAADRPLFAIGRNYTTDIFTNVVYQDPVNKAISVRTYDNLGKNQETYFRALGAIPPGGKYFFVVSAQYNLNDYKGNYENSPLVFKRGSWTIFSFHQLKLDKLSTFQMGGFIRTKGQQQFYELGNFGSVFASVNRYFLDRKLQITLNGNDIFYTNKNTFTLKQGSINAYGARRADTRRFGVNIRYNFGRKKKEEGNNPFNIDPDKVGN